MNWSNWIYLGVGLALGVGLPQLFARRSVQSKNLVQKVENQDRGTLEQQMKQTELAYYMAREMSQFKAGFLARTTHVLRSPLNGLIGLHQLILSNLCENPEEEREFIFQAQERALKLLKLIDEILNVARIEHGTNRLNIQPVQLAELLQQVHDLTYMLAENRNFPLLVLPPDTETYILADPLWLRQILVSLVEGCIAQNEEGAIRISSGASPTNNYINIWLDIPAHTFLLSEKRDLMASNKTQEENASVFLGMKLLIYQTLLEVMAGKMEIVSSPASVEKSDNYTRLEVSIPRVIPEAGFQSEESKQN